MVVVGRGLENHAEVLHIADISQFEFTCLILSSD